MAKNLCSTTQPEATLNRWPSQHRSACGQVSCSVGHQLLEAQQPLVRNTSLHSLIQLCCFQTYSKIPLGSCSANRGFPDRLGCYLTHQKLARGAPAAPLQLLFLCAFSEAWSTSPRTEDMDCSWSPAPQYNVFCKAPNTATEKESLL